MKAIFNINKNVATTSPATAPATDTQETEKPYTFRQLTADDLFLMTSIISKIGLKKFADVFKNSDIIDALNSDDKADDDKADNNKALVVGVSVALEIGEILLGNLDKCKDNIYNLLSAVSGMTVSEIRTLGFATFAEMIIDFVKKDEFMDFFKAAAKLFK